MYNGYVEEGEIVVWFLASYKFEDLERCAYQQAKIFINKLMPTSNNQIDIDFKFVIVTNSAKAIKLTGKQPPNTDVISVDNYPIRTIV